MPFPDTFFRIKMLWEEVWNIKIFSQSANAFSCFVLLLFIPRSNMTFKKAWRIFHHRENHFYVCHLNAGKNRNIFFMCGTWNIFSMCHHEENMRRWYAVYFSSSATWKCIFPKRSIFFIFSRLLSQLLRQFFLPSLLETLPFFLFFCALFWSWWKK